MTASTNPQDSSFDPPGRLRSPGLRERILDLAPGIGKYDLSFFPGPMSSFRDSSAHALDAPGREVWLTLRVGAVRGIAAGGTEGVGTGALRSTPC